MWNIRQCPHQDRPLSARNQNPEENQEKNSKENPEENPEEEEEGEGRELC